jgi:hypothetical protein
MDKKIFVEYPPFEPSFERFARNIRFDALQDVKKEIEEIFEIAKKRLVPAFCYSTSYVDAFGYRGKLAELTIDGEKFAGKALQALESVHRVFPYIATCGSGMETFDYGFYDMLAPYWVDAIKLQALGSARRALFDHCKESFHIKNLRSLNPGSGNVDIWPIEQMNPLFKLLEQGYGTGVKLSTSSLMVPNKSIAGMMFTTFDSQYESCAYCERDRCPDRRVAFLKVL